MALTSLSLKLFFKIFVIAKFGSLTLRSLQLNTEIGLYTDGMIYRLQRSNGQSSLVWEGSHGFEEERVIHTH